MQSPDTPWGCGKHPGEGRGRGAGPQGDPSPVGHGERQRVQPPPPSPKKKKTQPGPGEFSGAAALYLASSWVPGQDGAFPCSPQPPPKGSPPTPAPAAATWAHQNGAETAPETAPLAPPPGRFHF